MSKLKNGLYLSLLAVALGTVGCGGSSSGNSSGGKDSSDSDDSNTSFESAFPKSTEVFGVRILGTANTPDESMLHAANIMAQYLDNNEDGVPDNQAVVDQMVSQSAAMVMAASEDEIERYMDILPDTDALQDLYASEVSINDPNEFDASLEEVLHLITHVGYANAYPGVFGEAVGSSVADAMDIARGGQFQTIPNPYPAGAWYTYDDETCDYSCMVTEYVYWALTSMLGAQDFPGRLDNIQQEWTLNTPALVQANDAAIHTILSDAQYGLPTQLPDGDYTPTTFTIENNAGSALSNQTVSDTATVSNGGLTFELRFMGELQLEAGNQAWNDTNKQPYIAAANVWLAALTGVDGAAQHTIAMDITVKYLSGGNGEAGPDDGIEVGGFLLPTSGAMTIGNHTYEAGFDQVEFNANIVHEMGHIIGIGPLTEEHMVYEAANKGNVFRVANSKAVQMYNDIYGVSFDFVPLSDDGGHLYDHVLQEDTQRILGDGTVIPPLTKEVMANGTVFGSVALALLDDLGYTVDYSAATSYTP